MEDQSNFNPLLIIEEEIPPKVINSDNSDGTDDNDDDKSNAELFDFGSNENLETCESESTSPKRHSLLIVEEKDLMMMEKSGDLNNNSGNNVHRLSLQVDSGDENSLVVTNDAINRTIIKIGANASTEDFGEIDRGEVIDTPNEAINQNVDESCRRHSENYPDDGESIVNLLGQINDIVG